ncbi:MAG: phage tail tape measure protein [Pirellulales bacterium]
MSGTSGAIRAGRAFVELFADDSKLVRGLRGAEKKLQAWGAAVSGIGRQFMGLGLAVAAPLGAAAKLFADFGSQLFDMGQRTGVSVEALSELSYAAQQSGANMETLEGGLRKMQKFLVGVAKGSDESKKTLSRLGLTLGDLSHLAPEDQFALLGDRLSKINDPAVRAAVAMEVFGKTGTALLPMLSEGAAGLEAMRQQARDLGLTMSDEDAQSADALGDALDSLWATMKAGVVAIGAALAPTLTELAQSFARGMKIAGDWIKKHRDMIVTVAKIAVGVVAAGAALFALGSILSGLGAAFGLVATVVTGVGAALGVIGSIIGALLTPIGLVTAGIVALGAYLVYSSGAGAEALSWLGDRFAELKADALAAFQGISDALAAGDIGLAMRILWLALTVEWQKGVNFLKEHWIAFKEAVLAVWTEAVFGLASVMTQAWAGIQGAWLETVDFLSDAWTLFTDFIMQSWNSAFGFIQKAWVRLKGLFDEDLNVQAEVERINQEVAGKNQTRDDERNKRIFDREEARKRQHRQIDQQKRGTLDVLDQDRQRAHVDRKARFDADLKASEDALVQAKRERDAALMEAADKRKAAEEGKTPLGSSKRDFSGLDTELEQLGKDKLSVHGTFSAFAVRGLGGGDAADRTAKATEDTAKQTKKIVQLQQQNMLVFK